MNFYSHIVDMQDVMVELDTLELSSSEKNNLGQLLDANTHQLILDVVLSQLNEDDKHLFLDHLRGEDEQKLWEHLHAKVDKIEDNISETVEYLKKELLKDIKEAHKIK